VVDQLIVVSPSPGVTNHPWKGRGQEIAASQQRFGWLPWHLAQWC